MINKNIPNLITFSRIVGVASLFLLIPFDSELIQIWTILLFILISTTDFMDGWIARKFNSVSDLGKILDPLADKILILIFLPLLSMNVISAFPVFIILAREFSIMGLRVIAAKKNLIIAANLGGKLKTTFTIILIGLLIAKPVTASQLVPFYLVPVQLLKNWVQTWPTVLFDIFIWGTVLVTIWSFLEYLFSFLWFVQLQKNQDDVDKTKFYFLTFIPNSLSLINLAMGLLSIYFSFNSDLIMASTCVLIGLIFDGLDGMSARKLNICSSFGDKIDSKADNITFGFAPSVVLFMLFKPILFFDFPILSLIIAVFFYFCVYFRLRRFEGEGHSPLFNGLPSPVGATIICALVCSQIKFSAIEILILVIVVGLLMISKIKFPHHSHKQLNSLVKIIKYPTLLVIVCIILNHVFMLNLNQFYIVELLLLFNLIYLTSPIQFNSFLAKK